MEKPIHSSFHPESKKKIILIFNIENSLNRVQFCIVIYRYYVGRRKK